MESRPAALVELRRRRTSVPCEEVRLLDDLRDVPAGADAQREVVEHVHERDVRLVGRLVGVDVLPEGKASQCTSSGVVMRWTSPLGLIAAALPPLPPSRARLRGGSLPGRLRSSGAGAAAAVAAAEQLRASPRRSSRVPLQRHPSEEEHHLVARQPHVLGFDRA